VPTGTDGSAKSHSTDSSARVHQRGFFSLLFPPAIHSSRWRSNPWAGRGLCH
jgi:hypothetical protein